MNLQNYNEQIYSRQYDTLKEGEYLAKVIKAELIPVSLENDYGEKLSITWEIMDGDYKGNTVRQSINIGIKNVNNVEKVRNIARDQFGRLRFFTLGTEPSGLIKCATSTSDFLERQAGIVVKVREYNGVEYAEVSFLKDPKSIKRSPTNTAPQLAPGMSPVQPIVQPMAPQPNVYQQPIQQPIQQPVQQPVFTPPQQTILQPIEQPIRPPVFTPPQQPIQQPVQ